MELQVYRTSASSYQDSQFFDREQRAIQEIEGVKYIQSLKDIDRDLPFVLISNTHTNPHELSDTILNKTVLMIHPNSGHDNIDKSFVEKSNFPIVLGNPIRSNAVCEYVLSCIFHQLTPIKNHIHWDASRQWPRKLLRDQRVLIIGKGHVGKVLTNSLSPLCREVLTYDPHIQNDQDNISEWSEDLFLNIDILIIASSLNSSTKHMIDSTTLQKLSSRALIINPARGPIIKEDDLVQFLTSNPNAFAYLDVFEEEPFLPGHLQHIPNLNRTSHIAGVHEKLNNDIISFEYIIIKDFQERNKNNELEQFKTEYAGCILSLNSFK